MSNHDWLTTMVRAQREHAFRDKTGYIARHCVSEWLTMAGKPRGGRTATMRRRAALLGVMASIAALTAPAQAQVASSLVSPAPGPAALSEPETSIGGIHTGLTGRSTVLQMRGAGGIGDGTSHPVGTYIGQHIVGYGSLSNASQLAAIQAYPLASCAYATSTSDEMDLLAFRRLAADAIAAGGETVRPEAGIWMMSGSLPDTPAATDTATTRQATYSIVGAGSAFCIFRFMNDVSTGYGSAFALKVQNRGNADGTNFLGVWQGFTLVGPGTNIAYGTPNCQLSGIGWGARRQMNDIHVVGFYQGICLEGDQTRFDVILCSACTFGMFWDLANGTLFGDMQINRAQIVNCTIAAVGCSPVAQIPKIVWTKPIFATSPIGVAKLVNTGATGWQPNLLYENQMLGPQFENLGYAGIAEISSTTLLPTGTFAANVMVNCQLYRAQFGAWYLGAKFPTLNPSACIAEGLNCLGQNYISTSVEGNFQPGSNGLLNVGYFGGFNAFDKTTIEGDWDTIFANLRAITNTSGYARSQVIGSNTDAEHLILKSSAYAARFFYDATGLNPPLNTYVAFQDIGTKFQAAAGTTADAFAGGGTVKFRRTDGAGVSEPWILICTRGYTPVLTSNTWSGNQTVRTSSSGGPVAASGPTDATSYNLGVSYGGTSGGLANVRLFEKFNFIDT